MAELGIVAGGIGIASFTIQIVDSAIKLKELCGQIRDAPEEIQNLIEELEALSLVLVDVGNSDNEVVLSNPVKICLELCARHADALSMIVKELGHEIKKRKLFGGLRTVLKKGLIDRLRERLIRAQVMLITSHLTYLDVLQRQRHDILQQLAETHQLDLLELRSTVSQSAIVLLSGQPSVDRASTQIAATVREQICNHVVDIPSASAATERQLQRKYLNVKKIPRRQRKLLARIATPTWFTGCRLALELGISKAPKGWDFTIRTYAIISRTSPIFRAVSDGDLSAVQHLFLENEASPFDRSPEGETILDCAAMWHHVEMCRFLIDEGADPNISENQSSLETACMFGFRNSKPSALFDVVRLLAPLVENDSPHNFGVGSTMDFRGDAEVLTWLLIQSNYLEQRPSQEECLSLAFKLSPIAFQPNLASLIRIALGHWKIDPVICNAKDEFDNTLLHYLACNLGERCAMKYPLYSQTWSSTSPNISAFLSQINDPQLSTLLNLIRDLAQHTTDLHTLNVERFTPLLFLFQGYMVFSDTGYGYFYEFLQERNAPIPGASLAAHLFLSALQPALQSAGLSLTTYGKREHVIHASNHKLHEEGTPEKEYRFLEWKKVGDEAKEIRRSTQMLISFVYGEEVSEWRFWFVEVMEDAFAEFWEMVEHPEKAVPGAWDEDVLEEMRYYKDVFDAVCS